MNQENQLVIVFDIGTQSTRGMIIDTQGHIRAIKKLVYEKPYHSPAVDQAEQDPDFYYDHICRASLALKADEPALFAQVQGMAIATIRDTLVCVDAQGRPLRPAILWMDQRKTKGTPKIPSFHRLAVKTIGMETEIYHQYRKSHCNWIRENEPEIWARTRYALMLSGYLTFKVTGQVKDAVASMVGHIPFSSKTRHWLSKKSLIFPVFPIDVDKQCPIAETGEILGYVTESCADNSGLPVGLPMYATGGDKSCELLGLGCVDDRRAAVSFGTQAMLSYVSDRYVEIERFIPPFPSVIPGRYTPEFEIYRGYWLISWFKKEFAQKEEMLAIKRGVPSETILDETLASIPPGCEGLFFQPYFMPNITMPEAKGAMIGFSDHHTRHHIYRAIVEGINFALMDGLKNIERKINHRFERVALAGGGSKSDEICQIAADMYGIPTVKTRTSEATGVGASIATFVGMGVFEDYESAVKAMVHDQTVFTPNPKNMRLYDELYHKIYKRIYKRLKPLYHEMAKIESVDAF